MTMQAVIRAKFEEESKAAAKPVTSWLARQKLLPSRRIPFRKTKAEEASWQRWDFTSQDSCQPMAHFTSALQMLRGTLLCLQRLMQHFLHHGV